MRVLVPFDADAPKTRLAGTLTPDERAAFARAMCRDVLDALDRLDRDLRVEVLATGPVEVAAPVTVDERPLTEAVNAVLAGAEGPVAVVMADLAMATPAALARLFDAEGDVVLVPGRAGGTNAFVTRHPEFRVDYHGASVRDHRAVASRIDTDYTEVDSFRLSTDVDDAADLVEVLLHADGEARRWLQRHGFGLELTEGRVGVSRTER